MLIHYALVVLSLVILYFGAEGLVKGSASLSIRLGLTPLIVGLTVVAFGTSAPELVVSTQAAYNSLGDIAVGNAVGSNILNVGLILGLTAVICPLPVKLRILHKDLPIMIGATLIVLFFLYDSHIQRWEGAILFSGIIAYVAMNVIMARQTMSENSDEASDFTEEPPELLSDWKWDIAYIVFGLILLVLGSRILVDNSVVLAKAWGVSEAIIGLTIVAMGTGMPELTTCVVAALKKQADIAVGNVIGSNIFNLLCILGFSSLLMPLETFGMTRIDYWTLFITSILMFPLLKSGMQLIRIEGAILLASYAFYLYLIWPQ